MPNPDGRKPIDDSEAVEWVKEHRSANQRISHRAAANKFLDKHPDYIDRTSPDSLKDSVARRIADKVREEEGVLKRSRTTIRLLEDASRACLQAWAAVEEVLARERNRRR